MKQEDIVRQHEFNQDPELYQLDSDYPHVSPLERAQAFYQSRTQSDENIAPFAIEADGKYLGYCTLMHIQNRQGNLELGIMIGDRAYWGRGYGREVVKLLLDYGFRYLGARRIVLTTHAKNERAIRCFGACGFVEEGRPRQVVRLREIEREFGMEQHRRFVAREDTSKHYRYFGPSGYQLNLAIYALASLGGIAFGIIRAGWSTLFLLPAALFVLVFIWILVNERRMASLLNKASQSRPS